MNDPELEGLWDPSAGAGGYTRALERRLRPLRRDEPPPLVLPERATRTPSRVWTYAAVAFAAAVALVWVARRGPEEPAPVIARAPEREPPREEQGPPAWRVVALTGAASCQGEPLESGAPLLEGARVHTGEGAAILANGPGRVELHPSSELIHAGGALELVRGRAWIELPERADASPWRVRVGPLELTTSAARFVAWRDGQDELGIELVEGAAWFPGHDARASAGETCRASFELGPVEGLGALECEPTSEPNPRRGG